MRNALEAMSGYRIWRMMPKGVKKGRAHDDEVLLIGHLLRLLSAQTSEDSTVSPLPEGFEVSELSASPAQREGEGHASQG